jgi:hypothetical protein
MHEAEVKQLVEMEPIPDQGFTTQLAYTLYVLSDLKSAGLV